MNYQSPIRLFQYLQIYKEEIFADIPRLKKRLKAEFSLSNSGIMEVDSFSYNFNDLVNELDQSDVIRRLQFHYQIWDNKVWLSILEEHTVDLKNIEQINQNQTDSGFCQYVSPYFATAFNSIIKEILTKDNFHDASVWLSTQAYILPQNQEVAYSSLRKYLDEALYLFRNINKDNYLDKMTEIKIWTSNWSQLINGLPDYLFFYKDAIATGIINLTVTLQKPEKKLCYQISSELIKLQNLSPYLDNLIKSNHKIFKKDNRSYTFGWGFALFILIRLLAGSHGCQSNNDYEKLHYVDKNDSLLQYYLPKTDSIKRIER